MRGFRSNQRGRVQPVEYHDPKAPAQPQRYGARHRPRSAGASSRRYGSSRWPKHQYPAYPQYAGANQAAGRPSSSRPGSAPVNRPRQPSSANVDAWLRARHAAAPSSGYGQQRSYGQSSGYGQRIRAAVARRAAKDRDEAPELGAGRDGADRTAERERLLREAAHVTRARGDPAAKRRRLVEAAGRFAGAGPFAEKEAQVLRRLVAKCDV